MTHTCTWCLLEMASGQNQQEETARHGICGTCLRNLEDCQGTELLALVEALPHAALAVDGELRVRAANQQACDLLREEWASMLGHRLGEFLGCGHSPTPGSFDRGDCPGCALHSLVLGTLKSGLGAARLLINVPGREEPLPKGTGLRFSTLSVGAMVAVRLDSLLCN